MIIESIYDGRIIDYGDEDIVVHIMDKKEGEWRFLCKCNNIRSAIDIMMLYNPFKFTVKIKKNGGE